MKLTDLANEDILSLETSESGSLDEYHCNQSLYKLYRCILELYIRDMVFCEVAIYKKKEVVKYSANSDEMNPAREKQTLLKWVRSKNSMRNDCISFLDICTFFSIDESKLRSLILNKISAEFNKKIKGKK